LGPLDHRAFVVGVVAAVVLFPLCLLPRVDYLKYTSIAAVGCIIYLVVVIVLRGSQDIAKEDKSDLILFPKSVDIFQSIPLMLFAFTFHPNIFPIFCEMENATTRRVGICVVIAIAICALVYLFVGIFGYLTFLDDIKGNIFKNYDDDVLVEIGKILLAVVISFSYPLLHYPARAHMDSILTTYFTENRLPDITSRYVILTIILVGVSYGLGISIPDIEVVFSFVGATAGNVIVFVAPAAFFIQLTPGLLLSPGKLVALLMAILGVLSCIILLLFNRDTSKLYSAQLGACGKMCFRMPMKLFKKAGQALGHIGTLFLILGSQKYIDTGYQLYENYRRS